MFEYDSDTCANQMILYFIALYNSVTDNWVVVLWDGKNGLYFRFLHMYECVGHVN